MALSIDRSQQLGRCAAQDFCEELPLLAAKALRLVGIKAPSGTAEVDGWWIRFGADLLPVKTLRYQSKYSESAKTTFVEVSGWTFDFLIVVSDVYADAGTRFQHNAECWVIPVEHAKLHAQECPNGYRVFFRKTHKKYKDAKLKLHSFSVWQPMVDFLNT